MSKRVTRRGFVAGAVAVFSGCLGSDTGGNGNDDGNVGGTGNTNPGGGGDSEGCEGASVEENETTEGATGQKELDEGETTDEALDLREANVMAVTFGEEGEGTYDFSVTLYHDDEGEEGYANWWQVESLEGDCLGRRVLTHPHGTQRFTRSETVETGDRTCVVVRGHDQTHRYGGRAVVVDLETAETNGFLQGEEPSSFDEEDCP